MNPILTAILSVTVIGLICAVILVVASKLMAVKVDERVSMIRECLPGANCGACGYAGCDGYAAALIEEEGVKANLCTPGGEGTAKKIAELLGVEVEDVARAAAFVNCGGTCDVTEDKMDYRGIETCSAAKLLYGGKGLCSFRCMGFGDCAAVCPEDAICFENGIAQVDPRRCIGCGLCAKNCPNKLISIIPASAKIVVTCSSTEKGASTRQKCKHGCIGCMKCQKECPVDAIVVENNLAHIDYDKCIGCGKCAEVCVVGCIEKR